MVLVLRIQVYPVMDGIEFWMSWSCSQREPAHANHTSGMVHRYVSSEDVDKQGVDGAISQEVTVALHEFSEAADRGRC